MKIQATALCKRIVQEAKKENIAFVIGNGINLYPNNPKDRSWDDLLLRLYDKYGSRAVDTIPSPGMSLTELYDLILLEGKGTVSKRTIQNAVAGILQHWSDGPHHRQIVETIARLDAPILTTNFDDLLCRACGATRHYTIRSRKEGWSAFYPWQCYYSTRVHRKVGGFGIWFVHGMAEYPQSIRLGLADYLRTFSKAEKMRPRRINGKIEFPGENTWLKHFMEKSLFVFGLGLKQDEIFLRWLLIERAKHLRRIGLRGIQGWYVCTDGSKPAAGQLFFLNRVGLQPVTFTGHHEFYRDFWNRLDSVVPIA